MRNTLVLIVIVTLCGACAGVPPIVDPLSPDQSGTTIYLVHNGWHSGIVVPSSDLPVAVLPERADFPDARYLEVGWGDRDFYQTRNIGIWITLKAAFLPTASVVHIVGFSDPVTEFFPEINIIEFKLSPAAMERFSRYIHESLERGGAMRVPALGPGLYGTSRFYPATGRFHLFNTCHTWTAGAMRAGGYPFSPMPSDDTLLTQAKHLGRLL